mmetsp:Transcript_2613/g.5078  ORF Transcript_2613/g.5078 Transcript_2613/m.5078 type:complete len:882 (-) Transcript_2613:33-2678(-)
MSSGKRASSSSSLGSNVDVETVKETARGILEDVIVWEKHSDGFGLQWNDDDGPRLIAGWLNVKRMNFGRALAQMLKLRKEEEQWKHSFCVINDNAQTFEVCKLKKRDEIDFVIPFDRVRHVEIRQVVESKKRCFCIVVQYSKADESADLEKAELRSIEEGSLEVISRWFAILCHRTNKQDPSINELAGNVRSAAIKLQSFWRKCLALVRVNRLSMDKKNRDGRQLKKSALQAYLSRIEEGSVGYSSGEEPNDEADITQAELPKARSRPKSRQIRFQQKTSESPGEDSRLIVYDEIWENERWVLGSGWSADEEKGSFSDRLGRRFKLESLDKLKDCVPKNWQVKSDFTLDTPSVCDSDSWVYQVANRNLEADIAKGVTKGSSKPQYLVRRRRWVRERFLQESVQSSPGAKRLVMEGWAGLCGVQTGRFWKNRYCALVLGTDCNDNKEDPDYLASPCVTTDIPLSYWAYFGEHDSSFSCFEMKAGSSERSMNLKALDNECFVDDSVADDSRPGYFYIYLTGEKKPRLVNVGSAELRERWVDSFRRVIAQSGTPDDVRLRLEDLGGTGDSPVSSERSLNTTSNLSMRSQKTRRFVNTSTRKRILVERRTSFGSVRSIATTGNADTDACSGGFSKPEPYQNVIIDHVFDAPVEKMFQTFYGTDDFQMALFKNDSISKIKIGEWTPALKEGGKREMSYLLPRRGAMPSNTAYCNMEIVQLVACKGYQIDASARNPEVPYGKSFMTRTRTVMFTVEGGGTRFILSQDNHFTEKTMFKGFITSATTKEMLRYHKTTWLPFVQKYLQESGITGDKIKGQVANGKSPETVVVAEEVPFLLGDWFTKESVLGFLLCLLIIMVGAVFFELRTITRNQQSIIEAVVAKYEMEL